MSAVLQSLTLSSRFNAAADDDYQALELADGYVHISCGDVPTTGKRARGRPEPQQQPDEQRATDEEAKHQ